MDARPGALTSSLIAPVQRVPRYLMLFKDLQAKTPKDHPDYEDIGLVVEGIARIADEVNAAVRDFVRK